MASFLSPVHVLVAEEPDHSQESHPDASVTLSLPATMTMTAAAADAAAATTTAAAAAAAAASNSGEVSSAKNDVHPKHVKFKRPSSINASKLRAESIDSEASAGAAAAAAAAPSSSSAGAGATADHDAELDSTGHRVRGGGILASIKDVGMAPGEFAAGCMLLQAAALGDRRRVDALLRSRPDHVHFRDYDRRTALHVASSEGHVDIVRRLVELGAAVNRSDRWGGSPLDDAHRHRHADVAAYLRSRGATTGSADQTANLITAAAEGDLDEVRMLLSIDVRPETPPGGSSTVMKAPPIEGPVDINAGDYDKRTALHLAAGEGHAKVVEFLCKKGANVNIEDRWGGRPLDDARRRNFGECAAILERNGAKTSVRRHEDALGLSTSGRSGKNRTRVDSAESLYDDPNMRIDFSELEMIDRVGSGAFGEIYKCRWRGILVAAKCIKSTKIIKEWRGENVDSNGGGGNGGGSGGGGGGSPEKEPEDADEMNSRAKELALQDFRQETAILRKLRHPNICMLLAYSTTENFEVMISELMKCSLLDVFQANALQGTQMPKKTRIAYAQQLAQGMNYLHMCKPPIIHRDLKPANLLIDFSGTLKISDFGLAKIRPDPTKTEKEAFLMTGETGSYRFMAPEVFRHEEYTETVDVYSYAMILYYLLSGRAPWCSLNGLKAATKAAIDGDRPYIQREWDERLSALLKRCWDENPMNRPSFGQILIALGEYSRDVLKQDADQVVLVNNKGCNCSIM